MNVLELRGVSKSFGGVRALSDVTFEVPSGTVTGLIGPNGSGKSTLFNVISGILKPDAGSISYLGEDLTGKSPVYRAHAGIGRAFQIVRPLAGLSCLENLLPGLLYGVEKRSIRDARAEARQLLELVGLSGKADASASDLSLWEKKALEVARALSLSPKLLLLDEVFAGLAPGDVDRMVSAIRSIQADQGVSILLVEHVMRATMALCEHIVVLSYGEVLTVGEPNVVVRDPEVVRVYLGAADA